MGRIRTIKPETPQSESLGKVSRDARLLFIFLWTIVDDAGRARAPSRLLASLLFPYDKDAPDLIDGWLDELERVGSIRRYEVDGKAYLDIPEWLTHQKIDHPSKSRLPEFREPSRGLARTDETLAPDQDRYQDRYQDQDRDRDLDGTEDQDRDQEETEDQEGEPEGTENPPRRQSGAKPTRITAAYNENSPPPEWFEAVAEARRSVRYPPLSEENYLRRWREFFAYWDECAGARGRKKDWRRTWINNNLDERTERRFPPDSSGLSSTRVRVAI